MCTGPGSKRLGIDGDREAVPLTLQIIHSKVSLPRACPHPGQPASSPPPQSQPPVCWTPVCQLGGRGRLPRRSRMPREQGRRGNGPSPPPLPPKLPSPWAVPLLRVLGDPDSGLGVRMELSSLTQSSGWPVDQTSDLMAPPGVHQVFIGIKGALSEEAGRLGWRESCLGVLVAGGTLLLAGLELKAPGIRGLGLR